MKSVNWSLVRNLKEMHVTFFQTWSIQPGQFAFLSIGGSCRLTVWQCINLSFSCSVGGENGSSLNTVSTVDRADLGTVLGTDAKIMCFGNDTALTAVQPNMMFNIRRYEAPGWLRLQTPRHPFSFGSFFLSLYGSSRYQNSFGICWIIIALKEKTWFCMCTYNRSTLATNTRNQLLNPKGRQYFNVVLTKQGKCLGNNDNIKSRKIFF